MNPINFPGQRIVRRFPTPAKRLLIILTALTCMVAFPVASMNSHNFGLPHAAAAPCGVPGDLNCTPHDENGGNGPGDCGGMACPENGNGNGEPGPGPNNCGLIVCPVNDQDAAPVPTGPAIQADMDSRQFPHVVIMSAPLEKTFVQLKTSFWLKPEANGDSPYRRIDVHAKIGGPGTGIVFQAVHAWATPIGVTWDFGDGKTITCNGAGINLQGVGKPDCSHVYDKSSAHIAGKKYTVTATLTWEVQWECEAGACDPPGGPYPLEDRVEVGEIEFPVGEIQTEAQ